MQKRRVAYLTIVIIFIAFGIGMVSRTSPPAPVVPAIPTTTPPAPTLTPTPTLIPSQKFIPNDYHIFQTFNNCGPASLSMALSYFDINVDQQELANQLRPYQVPGGDNDDKSVTLEEVAAHAKEYGLDSYHRPAGTPDLIKQFLALDLPVIARTLTKPTEDIGHFRVLKGYDDTTGEFIQDDSLQGHNLRYSYDEFNTLWQQFNYEFVVLAPPAKDDQVKKVLGRLLDSQTAWQNAVDLSKHTLQQDPDDIYAHFNLSVAYYHLEEYHKSVAAFERVEDRLPFRTLWYQIEPILSYYELGNYQRVFAITDNILENGNRAYSEAYLIRGQIYEDQGRLSQARQEYRLAIRYNQSLKAARQALARIGP